MKIFHSRKKKCRQLKQDYSFFNKTINLRCNRSVGLKPQLFRTFKYLMDPYIRAAPLQTALISRTPQMCFWKMQHKELWDKSSPFKGWFSVSCAVIDNKVLALFLFILKKVTSLYHIIIKTSVILLSLMQHSNIFVCLFYLWMSRQHDSVA